MTQQRELGSMSFADLRDRLQARAEELGNQDDIDLEQTFRYLTSLPDRAHTSDSIDALFHLSRNFYVAARPELTIAAASLASRQAKVLDEPQLLCKALGMEGIALCDLGRFSESAIAYAEFWTTARAIGDHIRETLAIKNVGGLYAAMAQWDVAIRYLQRSRDLAVHHGHAHLELGSRVNIANCHMQLGDPASGLRELLPFLNGSPSIKREAATYASAHITLGHLYLSAGEVDRARAHAQEAARFAKLAGVKRTMWLQKALLGLIDVKSGASESGLAAVERGLAFAKRVDHMDVADYLGMCIDACDGAGKSDKALHYLQELVAWKKKLVDAGLPQYEGFTESVPPHRNDSTYDVNLRVREQLLQADVRRQVRRFVETAINAEMASGHDLYRTFRMAKLARLLATARGWDKDRVTSLTLSAQLCNVGMMAIPPRILQKPGALTDAERSVMSTHSQFGAQLLRKSRLQLLETAARVAHEHHEHFNGEGYPRGIRGSEISEEARIVAICDAFDTMTHRRPHRSTPLSCAAALDHLQQAAGHQLDPNLVRAFAALFRRELQQHEDLDSFLSEGAQEIEYVRVRAQMDAMVVSSKGQEA